RRRDRRGARPPPARPADRDPPALTADRAGARARRARGREPSRLPPRRALPGAARLLRAVRTGDVARSQLARRGGAEDPRALTRYFFEVVELSGAACA